MKLNENAMKLTNENNFTGNEFHMIPYGKGYEKAMKFRVPNEILIFTGFGYPIKFLTFHGFSLAFIGYPSSSEYHIPSAQVCDTRQFISKSKGRAVSG